MMATGIINNLIRIIYIFFSLLLIITNLIITNLQIQFFHMYIFQTMVCLNTAMLFLSNRLVMHVFQS